MIGRDAENGPSFRANWRFGGFTPLGQRNSSTPWLQLLLQCLISRALFSSRSALVLLVFKRLTLLLWLSETILQL